MQEALEDLGKPFNVHFISSQIHEHIADLSTERSSITGGAECKRTSRKPAGSERPEESREYKGSLQWKDADCGNPFNQDYL